MKMRAGPHFGRAEDRPHIGPPPRFLFSELKNSRQRCAPGEELHLKAAKMIL
jgi:hypothetical protein